MNTMMTKAVRMIDQNVADRRQLGEPFITQSERDTLQELALSSEGSLFALPEGLQGLGSVLTASADSTFYEVGEEETQQVGLLIAEIAKAIEAAVYVSGEAESLLKHPVREDGLVLAGMRDATKPTDKHLNVETPTKEEFKAVFDQLPEDLKEKYLKEIQSLIAEAKARTGGAS